VAAQQLHGGGRHPSRFVQNPFALERVNTMRLAPPNRKKCSTVSSAGRDGNCRHIPDHAIDIEEQNGLLTQGCLSLAGRLMLIFMP